MGQKIAAFDTQGNINAYYDDIDSPIPNGVTNVIEITDTQYIACISTPGYTVQNGSLVVPLPQTAEQITAMQTAKLWTEYQSTAQSALDKSDVTILRCTENSVAVPTAWATYRAALRAIVRATTGDATQPLPTRPAYPSGT